MAPASQLSPALPGDTIAGRYRVERVIGIGGMGVVVAARHLELDHLVAIKFLLPKVAENKDVVGRFTREARAAVKIQNDHVARVTDVGTLESGEPYMVMEYLDGTDLEDFSRQSGPLSIEDCTDFVLQACEAIAEAHGLGIVHRDLKPANLFLVQRPDGSRIIKVLDFGISKVTGAGNSVAPTTAMLGSPPYMSPEQLTTPRDIDARTDIWALGVILYRLLTGRVPFDADTIVLLCSIILHGDPPPLREARANVPPALEAVVSKCLAKDRAARYANVGELAQALLEFAPERSRVSVERVLHLTAAQPSVAETVQGKRPRGSNAPELIPRKLAIETNSSWGQTARGAKHRSRRSLGLVATALLVLGAFGAWRFGWLHATGQPDATASVQPAPLQPAPLQPAPLQPAPLPPAPQGGASPAAPAHVEPPIAPATQPVASTHASAAISGESAAPEGQKAAPPASAPVSSAVAPFRGSLKPRRTVPAPGASPGRKSAAPNVGNWEEQRK